MSAWSKENELKRNVNEHATSLMVLFYTEAMEYASRSLLILQTALLKYKSPIKNVLSYPKALLTIASIILRNEERSKTNVNKR